jgi:drug/metabolite transporter (DMT)-like permease
MACPPQKIDPMKPEKAVTETLPQFGFVLLLFLSIFWGSNWPLMKIGLREIPVWTFRTLCLFLGGFGVLGMAKANGLILTIPRSELRPLILVSILNITGWHLCSAYGLITMDAGRAVIIGYTMPVWASILATFILGERLTFARLIGLFLGIAGLLILIGPDIKALGSAPLGAIFMLGAAVTWAGGTVLLKYFRWTMPITVLTGWQLILGGIPVIIGAFILEPMTVLLHVSWQGALATGYVI